MDIAKALEFGWPTAHWSCGEKYDSIDWMSDDIPIPSEKEVIDKWHEYLVNKALYQYRTDRKYPSIKDQLDMMYWDKIYGDTTWIDCITSIKNNHPKPEGID